MNRLILCLVPLLLLGCSEKAPLQDISTPTAEVDAPQDGKKRTRKKARKAKAKAKSPGAQGRVTVGDAPPMPGMRMDVRVDDESGSHQVSAGVGGLNMGVQLNVNVNDPGLPAAATPPPAPRPVARTCKAALLNNGHAAGHLVHCEDTNDRCAVALLNAGHSPASLVHCQDVQDVSCAVQLLRSGKSPSQIVHCD